MNVCCRFTSCQWSGSEDEIFHHIESNHRSYLRQPKGNLYFDFSFNDLQQEVFVLVSPNGVYWFRRNTQNPRSNGIDYGVFHVGESEQVEYELKLGLKRDGHCEYWGPYTSEQDNIQETAEKENYNFEFNFDFLKILNETMPSQRLRLYFGPYDDSDDKIYPGPQDVEWKEEDEHCNRLCVEYFICPVCFEYIRHDARFCENDHFICNKCFEKLYENKNLICPTCRGMYLYNSKDHDLERLLHMVKWPDMPKIEMDIEMLEYLKSLPKLEFVKVKGGEHF